MNRALWAAAVLAAGVFAASVWIERRQAALAPIPGERRDPSAGPDPNVGPDPNSRPDPKAGPDRR